jgi:hypothetical protein
VSVRLRTGEDLGGMPVADFVKKATDVAEKRSLALV